MTITLAKNPGEAPWLGGVKRGLEGQKTEETHLVVFLVEAEFSQLFLRRITSSSRHLYFLRARAVNILLLKIKEAIHIQWEQLTLNHQLYHVNLKLSL